MPALVYANSKGEHQELILDKPAISVGRQAGNDIVLPDPLVSRKHCTIRKDGAKFVLSDHGSTYGTFVNDERVDGERGLSIGDRLRIGNTAMRFVEPDSGVKMQLVGPFEDTGGMSLSSTLNAARSLAVELSEFLHAPGKGNAAAAAETAEHLVDRLADTQAALAALEQTQRLTQTLGEVGKALAHIPDLDTVFRLTMDLAIRALRADRGFILVEEGGKLETKVSRNMGDVRGISTSIAEKVFQECKPVLTTDAQADPRFNQAHSVMMNAIRAVMCVPLELAVAKDKTKDGLGFSAIGAIYVDGGPGNRMFNERGLEFLAGFAHQAAIAIQNARLAEKSANEEKLRHELERYFSEAVINEIVKKGGQLGGESRLVTLLFTDIRGFTAMLEKLQPREAVEMLNEYFSELVDEILAHGGTLDKFTGDGVMAFWNAPTEQHDHAQRAVRAAMRIQERIPNLLARWRGEARPFVKDVGELATGIGINTGEAVVGNIGSSKRVDYTAIGDAVNLTARVQGHAKGGEVLVTAATRELLGNSATVEELPPVTLKGKSKSVPIFRVQSMGIK